MPFHCSIFKKNFRNHGSNCQACQSNTMLLPPGGSYTIRNAQAEDVQCFGREGPQCPG